MHEIPKRRIDRLVPEAIKIIKEGKVKILDNGKVPSAFHGYVSSFGADIINASPLAAAIYFEDSSGSEEDRSQVSKALLLLLRDDLGEEAVPLTLKKLSEWFMEMKPDGTKKRLPDVTAAAIALKLALRTFPKSKKETRNHETE